MSDHRLIVEIDNGKNEKLAHYLEGLRNMSQNPSAVPSFRHCQSFINILLEVEEVLANYA